MKFAKLYFLISIAITIFANAEGNKVGNGGNGIFCKNQKIAHGKLLDFYEEKINFTSSEADPILIAEKQLTLLKVASPKLSEQYLRRLKEISSQIDFKNDVALTEIKDSEHLFKPLSEDCHVFQVAIRKKKTLTKEKLFLIRKDLWDQLTPLDQAGLLTHEIIYEHFSKLGEENSIKARRLNRYIYQITLNKEEFWKFIKELEIPLYPQ